VSEHRIVLAEAEPGLVEEIDRELLAAIRSTQPQALNSGFILSVLDDDRALIAGLVASTAYGWLLVKILWVAENKRGRGLGRRLMGEAEAEGIRRGCHGAWLDTSMPDAARFYERLGYETFGLLENGEGNVVPGHKRWFMRKRLG
jgi:GNAT superfamily N-acetyltransferase